MNKARHTKTGRWSRRILGVPVAAWLAVGAATTALAVWAVLISVTGTVTTATATVNLTGPPATESGTCSATGTNFGTATEITWSNTVGGSTCVLAYGMKGADTNTVALKLQGFNTAATGIDATLGAYCGTTIPAASSQGQEVKLTLSVNDDATFGQVIDLAGSAFEWVPSADYNPAECA